MGCESAIAEPGMRGKLQRQKRGLILYKYSTGNRGIINTVFPGGQIKLFWGVSSSYKLHVILTKVSVGPQHGPSIMTIRPRCFRVLNTTSEYQSTCTFPFPYRDAEDHRQTESQLGHAKGLKNSAKPYDKERSLATTK